MVIFHIQWILFIAFSLKCRCIVRLSPLTLYCFEIGTILPLYEFSRHAFITSSKIFKKEKLTQNSTQKVKWYDSDPSPTYIHSLLVAFSSFSPISKLHCSEGLTDYHSRAVARRGCFLAICTFEVAFLNTDFCSPVVVNLNLHNYHPRTALEISWPCCS